MQSLKENFFVKTSYAYFNLFKKLYFLVLFIIIAEASAGIGGQNPRWACNSSVDFYNLFHNFPEFFRPNSVPFTISMYIILSNLFVFFITYLIIIKLDKFLKNLYEDNPFIPSNGRYLKSAGTATMVLAIFLIVKDIFLKMNPIWISLWARVLIVISQLLSIFFSPYFIIGLFIYTLGEIIIRGSKLKEELDLTI